MKSLDVVCRVKNINSFSERLNYILGNNLSAITKLDLCIDADLYGIRTHKNIISNFIFLRDLKFLNELNIKLNNTIYNNNFKVNSADNRILSCILQLVENSETIRTLRVKGAILCDTIHISADIVKSLATLKSLKYLDFCRCHFRGFEPFLRLLEELKNCSEFEELYVEDNEFANW